LYILALDFGDYDCAYHIVTDPYTWNFVYLVLYFKNKRLINKKGDTFVYPDNRFFWNNLLSPSKITVENYQRFNEDSVS